MYCDMCGQPLLPGEQGPAHAACAAPAPDAAVSGVATPVHAPQIPAPGPPPPEPHRREPPPLPPSPVIPPQPGPEPEPAPAAPSPPESTGPGQWHRGWPPDWPKPSTLVVAAFLRNWRGSITAIVCAWFGVPFVLLMAALGAIVGSLTGFVSGSIAGEGVTDRIDAFFEWIFPLPVPPGDLIPTAAVQIGGVIGAMIGGISGGAQLGWMAAVWPWKLLYAGDPTWPVALALGQVVAAVVCASLYTIWAFSAERWRLRLRGARMPSQRESDLLDPIIDDCAAKLGLHGRPVLLMNDSRAVNASAGFRHLTINRGMLDATVYDPQQLGGVISHELVHWRDGHVMNVIWLRALALPLYLAYELSTRLIIAARVRPLQMAVRILTWAITTTVERIVIPAQARASRQQEFDADQGAITTGYDTGLIQLLGYLRDSFDGDESGWSRVMCRTHPPTELRINRLGDHVPPLRKTSVGQDRPHPTSTIKTGW